MKKVLFIYYHFPPIMGDWRGLGFVKFLPEFGWQPVVISAAESVSYGKDYGVLQEVPDNIEVHRVGHQEQSQEWTYLRRKLRMNYVFPDEYRSWYSPALREARRILRKEKVDLIFSSCPPYTAFFVAMKLKREFHIPWVAEWRDPWSGSYFFNRYYDETLIKPLRNLQKFRVRRAERDILKAADRTIALGWQFRQQFCETHGIKEGEIAIITNGYDEADYNNLRPRPLYPDRLTIVFLGSFYPEYREIILRFLRVVDEIDRNAEVVFIGRGAAEIEGANTGNFTRILHLARQKALAFSLGSDFLLLVLPPAAKLVHTVKLFEYLRLGKPILAFVPEDGEAAKIIREAKAGFILSHEPGEMREQLKAIFDEWTKGKFKDFHPDREYIAQFERRKLTQKLAELFDEVITPTMSKTGLSQ